MQLRLSRGGVIQIQMTLIPFEGFPSHEPPLQASSSPIPRVNRKQPLFHFNLPQNIIVSEFYFFFSFYAELYLAFMSTNVSVYFIYFTY